MQNKKLALNNLLVDIGNTAIKAAWAEGTTLGKVFRYQGEKHMAFIQSLTSRMKPEIMVISSVYEINQKNISRLESFCGKLILLDPSHTDVQKYHGLPEELSSDRAASIVAVRHLFQGKSVTLFDLGTVMTVDFIDSEGKYEGGNISIGALARFKAINRYSKSLPLVGIPEQISAKGSGTVSSIESGVISGIMFEIEGYLSDFSKNIAVFTGGDAIYFAKRMKNSIFVVCNLVLTGLALMAQSYYER